ncbi:hypothetical protein Taro_023093, partial [Colocasia esculenta]|nr:hypothetical protein [Colocasia esculenta]
MRMECFIRGTNFDLWQVIKVGDYVIVPIPGTTAITAANKSKLSLNFKAKNYLCCALSKREFSRVSACKSAKEIWDKLQMAYEGTDKVKQTRIDILVSQYEQFKILPNENITQMYNRFSSIVVGLSSLGKNLSNKETVRKILRSLTLSWTPKVTAIEEAHDLTKLSIDNLIGSLMAHEINMERLSKSSSKKKCTNDVKTMCNDPRTRPSAHAEDPIFAVAVHGSGDPEGL